MSFQEFAQAQYSGLLGPASAGERRFRERAWDEYSRLGLPSRKTETWKYSSLNALTGREWPLSVATSAKSELSGASAVLLRRYSAAFDTAVLLDGVFRPDLSSLGKDYELKALDLGSAGDIHAEDGWSALSAAVARPGLDISVAAGVQVKRPLLIVHAHVASGTWLSCFHRLSIGAGGHLAIAETFGGDGEYMCSDQTRVHLGSGARLDWLRVQAEAMQARHFSDVRVEMDRDSHLSASLIALGGAWSRSSLSAQLLGPGAEAQVSGLIFGGDTQHLDQRVELRHHAAHTSSAQLFKSVLKDKARGILNGKIFIAQDAQQVASSQYNHCLLLGSGAEADTKPELEIYADDVKANHGASVGRLDEDKIFYLMSRGIPRAQAQQVLSQAFVMDVLMKIKSSGLRSFAEDQVTALLPRFLEVEA